MRNGYPQFAIETLRYLADRRGWLTSHRVDPADEPLVISAVVTAIGRAETLSSDECIKAAVAMTRRKEITGTDWLEAASLVAAVASRSTMMPNEVEQRRARALDGFLSTLATYFNE